MLLLVCCQLCSAADTSHSLNHFPPPLLLLLLLLLLIRCRHRFVQSVFEGDVDEQVAHNDEDQAEEEEEVMAAYDAIDDAAPESPPAKKPANPFSKKDRAVIASPPRKRKNVFDLLKGMGVSEKSQTTQMALHFFSSF